MPSLKGSIVLVTGVNRGIGPRHIGDPAYSS